MSECKRWRISLERAWNMGDPDVVETNEDAQGQWVGYADHAAALAERDERIAKLEEALTEIRDHDYRGNRCSCSLVAEDALEVKP